MRHVFFKLILAFCIFGVSNVSASPADRIFNVRLRAILGQGVYESSEPPVIAEDLFDLQSKLGRLKKYATFKMVREENRLVRENGLETVSLGDYGEVSLRPMASLDDVVTLWLRWAKADMEVLNTKLKFRCKEALLTGLESEEDGGVLLAVNVSPQ